MATLTAIALIAYLLGSFPSGYIAGWLVGIDVRNVGSGNVGATNVTRVLGKRFGYPVFLADFAKGLVAVIISVAIAKRVGSTMRNVDLVAAVAGVFAVVGHSYPMWLRFRGGKGVATSVGALFGIDWIAALIVCAVWLVTFQVTRYVSLSSIAAAIAFPLTIATMLLMGRLHTPILLFFSLSLAAIVLVRHRSNMSRLLAGTEPRFARK